MIKLRHFCPDRRCPISMYYESRPCVLSVGGVVHAAGCVVTMLVMLRT